MRSTPRRAAGPPTGARIVRGPTRRSAILPRMPSSTPDDAEDDDRLTVGADAGTGERRPWGAYVVLDDGPLAKVKRITVEPGQRLSYQRHHRRAEHWFVVSGTALVTLDDVDHELGVGE